MTATRAKMDDLLTQITQSTEVREAASFGTKVNMTIRGIMSVGWALALSLPIWGMLAGLAVWLFRWAAGI